MAIGINDEEELEEDWATASVAGVLNDEGDFEDWSSASSRPLTGGEKRDIADSLVRTSQQTGLGGDLARQDPEYQAATDAVKKKMGETSFIDEVSSLLPFESLQTQGGKELRQLQAAQAAAAKTAGSVPLSEVPVSKNPLDWISSLTSDPSAVSVGDLDRGLENIDTLKRTESLKSIFSPEEFTNLTRDAAAENWDYNDKGWNVRSDGEFKFSPALLNDRTKFATAMNDAEIPQDRAALAMQLFDQKAAEDRSGLIQLAKKTSTFQSFATRPENQGKSDEEIYSRFEKSGNWVDWVKSNVISMPGQTVQYVASQMAGAAFAASALSDSSSDGALAKVGRALNEFTNDFTPYDVRYSNVMGQTVSQFVPQIATKMGLDLALRRVGLKGPQAEFASQAFTALSAGAQIGAENYRTVFEANQERYGVDAAHEMAMEAFKKSVPLGVSELLSLDVLLSKAPKGKGWAVLKNLASSLAEVGTEQFQNAMSNAINKGASAAYVKPQTMGLGESLEMAAGTSLVELAVGGLQRRARNIAERRVKEETEKIRQAAQNAANSDAPQTAAALDALATKNEAGAAEKTSNLATEILDDLESEDGFDDATGDGTDVSDASGVISGDTTSTDTATSSATTPEPAAQPGLNIPTPQPSTLATPAPATAAQVQVANVDSLVEQGGGTVAVQDGDRSVNFKQFGIGIDGNTAEVAFVELDPSEQGRGIGLQAYRALGNELAARGITLRSSGAQYGPGSNLWIKLAQEGSARRVGQRYEFVAAPKPDLQPATTTAPEISPQPPPTTPTTTEGGEVNEESELRMRNQEGRQGRGPEGLTTTPNDSGAGAEGAVATPPPTEAPAPLPDTPAAELQTTEQQTTEPQPTGQQGDRVAAATGAKGVISKKPLPVEEVQTGTDEEGRPIARVVPRFVNDPNTLAESLHQNGGAERIYIPDEIIDDEQIDDDNIGFAFEKGTGRAYVTWARHLRFPDAPVMENGRTEDNATLEQLYQNDPRRKENSEAQTKGEGVGLAELDDDFIKKLDAAPLSKLEQTDPDAVARELAKIDSMAAKLAEETVVTNDGAVASVGASLADLIAQAAKNKYLGRLRGVVSGDFADANGVIRDVKARALRSLKSRGGENVGVSLDQNIGDGTTTVGDVTAASQAIQDEDSSAPTADTEVNDGRGAGPQDVSEALQFALDMAVMDLSDADRATWLEYKKRTTEKREGGKGAYRLTNEQKRVAELVRQKANDMLVEDLAQERDVDDETGALKPPKPQILTEAEQAQMDDLNKRVDEREAQKLEDKIRRQTREVLAMANVDNKKSVDLRTILETLANDKKQSALVRYFANWLAKSPHDFGNVKLKLSANRSKRTRWAGLYESGNSADAGTIKINTAADHRGGIGQTILHEALHHIVIHKIRPSYKRNPVEKAAYRDLMKILTHTRRSMLMPEPTQTLGQVAKRKFGSDDTFYGLTNLDELFTETLTNERFFEWLNSQDAIPGLQTKGTFRNLWSQLKQAFHNFVYGVQVRPDSLLAQSLDNIMALSRDPQSDRKIRDYQNTVAERKRMVAESVRGDQKRMLGEKLADVLQNAVAEPSESPLMGVADYDAAKELLMSQLRNPEIPINARGGVRVSLNSPDPSTAKYIGIQDPIEARAIHLLTEQIDRKTADPDKVRTAGQIVQTLRQADFVGYYDWAGAEGKVPMLVYAKLYKDPESPTGTRWHFVEVRDLADGGVLETQYSSTEPTFSRATRSTVQWIGDSPKKLREKNKKRDGGAGHAQDLLGADPQKYQGMLPDVSPTARENIDTTTDESVQLEILEAVTALTEKRARLLAQQSYKEAGQVDEQIRQLEEKFSQSPTPPSPASIPRKERRRLEKEAQDTGWKTGNGWQKFIDKIGLGEGVMDSRVWARIQQTQAEIRGAHYLVEETARKFNRLVKKHSPNAQTLRDALGTTDNRLEDAQYDQWQKLKRAAQRETDPVKRQAALAAADTYRISQAQANITKFKAVQQSALNQLPKELRDTVTGMRQHIDKLSQSMISKGMVGSNLQATIGDNLEVYLNRAYEVFDNPDWKNFIRTDQSANSVRIRNNAMRTLRSQLVAEEARRIRRNAKLNNQAVPTRQAALAAAQASVTPEQVENLMIDYLRVGDDAAVAILGGRLPGKPDTSIIKLRGQIPKEIRELWGEYQDADLNFANTFTKLAGFTSAYNFQSDFFDMGMNGPKPFLWKEGVSSGQKPVGWVEIYKGLGDSPNPNPMAGVYGPEIISKAMQELNETYKSNAFMQLVGNLTGFAMASKTIYNPPQTYVRNFLGNGLIMMSQGYFTKDLDQLGFFTRFGNSAATTGDRLFGARRERSDQVVDYVTKLVSLGVMGDNVKANVLKELTSVLFDRDPKNAFNKKLGGAMQTFRAGNQRLLDAYQAGDDFWKILAFESERSTFAQAYPNATPEALDRMAADRVRDVVPTYSKLPKFVREIVKGQPYVAPYISWTSEIIRTTANTWRHAAMDMMSGNPTLQKSGAVRMFSAGAVQGLLMTLPGLMRDMLFSMDEEDEKALRRFLPDWQVNALLLVTGKKDGKITFWDFSYLNPYDVLLEPFIAMNREAAEGGSGWDIAAVGAEKAMAPWTGEQLLFGAVLDVARGYTKDGRPLNELADSATNNRIAEAKQILNSLTPGAFNFSTRLYKAFQGEVSPGGKVYNLEDEFLGAVLGQKPGELDMLQTFQNRKLSAMERMMRSANNLANKEFRTRGTADLAKIQENYIQSNNARMGAFKEIRKDMDALESAGIPRNQIFAALKTKGISDPDIEQIANGKYVRRFPGQAALEASVGVVPNFQARVKALQDARDAYPEVQDFLTEPERSR